MNGRKFVDVGKVRWFWFTTSAFGVDQRPRPLFPMLHSA